MPKEYPPREFSAKYERFMAPSGVLLTPNQAFKGKSFTTPEETFKKAFEIVLKKIRQMSSMCGNCFEESETCLYCPKCDFVWYCSEECQVLREESHEKICSVLELEKIDQIVECFPSPVPIGLDVLKGKGGPVKDWEDWFTRHTAIGDRIIKATDVIKAWWNLTGTPYPGDDALNLSLKRVLSNVFSTALTIGHSPLHFGPTKAEVTELNIHLIGADEPEVSLVDSGIIHLASRILKKQLTVTLVAPDLAKHPDVEEWTHEEPFQASPQVKAISYVGLYHEFWRDFVEKQQTNKNKKGKLSKVVPPPDVAVAIHPGVHTEEMYALWRPTLQLLADNQIPLVMTTYNQAEHEATLEILKDFDPHILMSGSNTHGSMQQRQTPYEPDHIWALNSYIIVIDNRNNS